MSNYITEGDCIIWPRAKDDRGYGKGRFGPGRSTLAHRVAYEDHYGVRLDRQQVVMHMCDNPSCVNVDHLRVGTVADNQADMAAKRRGRGRRRYTADQVIEIRQAAAAGEPLASIAKRFDASPANIGQIVHDEAYREIGGPRLPAVDRRVDSPELREAIATRHLRRESMRSVARRFNTTHSAIRYIVARMENAA